MGVRDRVAVAEAVGDPLGEGLWVGDLLRLAVREGERVAVGAREKVGLGGAGPTWEDGGALLGRSKSSEACQEPGHMPLCTNPWGVTLSKNRSVTF